MKTKILYIISVLLLFTSCDESIKRPKGLRVAQITHIEEWINNPELPDIKLSTTDYESRNFMYRNNRSAFRQYLQKAYHRTEYNEVVLVVADFKSEYMVFDTIVHLEDVFNVSDRLTKRYSIMPRKPEVTEEKSDEESSRVMKVATLLLSLLVIIPFAIFMITRTGKNIEKYRILKCIRRNYADSIKDTTEIDKLSKRLIDSGYDKSIVNEVIKEIDLSLRCSENPNDLNDVYDN